MANWDRITTEDLNRVQPRLSVWQIYREGEHGWREPFVDKVDAHFWAEVLNYGEHVQQRTIRDQQIAAVEQQMKEREVLVEAGLRNSNDRFDQSLQRSREWYADAEATGRFPRSRYYVEEVKVY